MLRQEIFVIDAHSLLYRNYYALPKLNTPSGEEVGAIYGFTKFLLKILNTQKSDFFVVVYDSPAKGLRHKIFPEYKANREKTDEALIKQIKLSREIVNALGLVSLCRDGYEADDLICSVSKEGVKKGFKVIIISNDKDLMQLVNEDVLLWDGTSEKYFGREYVESKFGVPPERIVDYLALRGDASDNIPGVKGIGHKTAVKLIEKYGNVNKMIDIAFSNSADKELLKIRQHIEELKLSMQLVKLDDTQVMNIETLKRKDIDEVSLKFLAERLMFKELLSMLKEHSIKNKDKKSFVAVKIEDFLKHWKEYISFEPDRNIVIYENEYSEYGDMDLPQIIRFNGIKYFYNLKNFLHQKKVDFSINNFEDIYIAYHLCYGGDRKPELKRIITENCGVIQDSPDILYSSYFKNIADNLIKQLEEKKLINLYRNIELPLVDVLYKMEKHGIKINLDKLKLLGSEFDKKIHKIKEEFVKLSGCDINLNSPKQVSEFIYNKLSLPLDEKQKKTFKTKTGYSTSEEALKFMSGMHPTIDFILSHRELVKLKTSFIEPLIEKVSSDGRIRTIFDQTGTQTGRLSSSSPNLQNIPVKTETGQKIRECFVAEEGYLLLSADYSQIDLRVLAHLSEDEVLMKGFMEDEDIHLKTACEVFSLPPEEIDSQKRRIAKTINFGIIYGQTPMGLSRELGIDYRQAETYIKNYFNVYSGVKKWIDETLENARKNGYVKNFVDRRRNIPDINSKNKNLRLFFERVAINMPVQSGSSDIIKKAMIDLDAEIKDKKDIRMILQIHDELLFEIKKDKVDLYAKMIKERMERAFKLKVPLKVDVKIGENWAEMKKII